MSSPPNPTITYMCRDLIRYVVDLCGYEFLEQEVAYYKHRAAAPQPLAYPLPGPPALIPVPIKQEEIVVVDAAPAPAPALILPAVIEAVVQPPAPENRVVEISAPVAAHAAVVATAPKERSRYKRTELADEARCTANTTRGTRCTLERETGKTVCSRHVSST